MAQAADEDAAGIAESEPVNAAIEILTDPCMHRYKTVLLIYAAVGLALSRDREAILFFGALCCLLCGWLATEKI